MSDQEVNVKFGADVAAANAGIRNVGTNVKDFANQAKDHIDTVTHTFTRLQEAMLGIAAIVAGGAMFKEMISATVEATSQVTALQKSFGMTLAEANQTRSSLNLLGLSTDEYTKMAFKLDRQLRTGNEALTKIGLTAKDLDLGQKGLMDKAIAKLGEFQEGVHRNEAAMIMFGRSGAEASKLLRLNLEGVQAKAKELEEALGLTVTEQDKTNARQYKIVINELGMAFEGIKKAIGSAVLPYLTAFGDWFVNFTPVIIKAMKDNMAAIVEGGFAAAEGFINFIVKVMGGVYNLFVLWEWIQVKLGNTSLSDAHAAIDEFDKTLGSLSQFRDKAIGVISDLKEKVMANKPFEGLELGMPGKGTKSAQGLIGSSGDGVAAAMKEVDGEIKILREGLAQKKLILDQEVAQHRISQNEKFAALQFETQKEYEAELAKLDKEKAIGGLSLAQRQVVENKILELKAKHNTEMISLDGQAIAAQTKMWQGYLSAIQSAWDSQLRGLLAGTTSFKQAMKNIFGDLIIGLIQAAEKMGIEWAAAQLGMTTASTTGAAARAAAEQAATTATLPGRIAKFTSDIMAQAALTFAGIMANLSPIMGPAAAGPAAAGQATVLAEMANIPKLDVGTPYVLKTGLAMLHKNEAVVPADVAGAWRNGDGPGVDTHVHHHWNIQANHPRDFIQQLRDVASPLSQILRTHASLNPARG
jgi:hypothetical protein